MPSARSCTTRPPRTGERDGVDYHFLSDDEFERRFRNGEFLETAQVFSRRYGTLRAEVDARLDAGKTVLLDIDVQGAERVREYVRSLPDSDPLKVGYADVFIRPPSMEELRRRLEGRGTDSPEAIERRMANAEGELARAGEFMYRIDNDDLGVAYRRLCDLIDALSGRM